MAIGMSYMGTKRALAPHVLHAVSESPRGPLLDIFSGICSVGESVSPYRQVWCNDAQQFAATVAQSIFTSDDLPPTGEKALSLIQNSYSENFSALSKRFADEFVAEERVLQSPSMRKMVGLAKKIGNVGSEESFERERRRLQRKPDTFPFRLFTITFANAYFSLRQCIEFDSLRYAISHLRESRQISTSEFRWLLVALGQAASKVSTTTGHFAQYLTVKPENISRFCAQRRRSVVAEWVSALSGLAPKGSRQWRANNKVFCSDALALLQRLRSEENRPAVIYADPPYTDDQYSRYYHLLETLVQYDYPAALSKGLYRPDRFVSEFSSKKKVASAFSRMIARAARTGADLVISYPDNGLLETPRETILDLLRTNFKNARVAKSIKHLHSSMGASKGPSKSAVTEVIYVGHQ